eukprot:UN27398
MRKLSLSHNDLGSRGTKALFARFDKDSELTELILEKCRLDIDEFIERLTINLKALQTLSISENQMSDDQGLQLSAKFARTKFLVDLRMVNCGISQLTIPAIAAVMLKKKREGNVRLDFSNNYIGSDCSILIASLLSSSHCLE